MSSSAARALRILDLIGRADCPLGVTQIARNFSLAPSTVFRSLDALARAGLIARYRESSRYVPGSGSEHLRRNLIAGFRMRELVLPYLRQLASVSGETASLHVRIGWYGVRIASAPGTAEVTNTPALGETQILGGYSSGRAMLAFLSDLQVADHCAWAARQGAHLPELERRLRIVRDQGFALGDGEFDSGTPIAFPVRPDQKAVAAIAIEGPVFAKSGPQPRGLTGWLEIVGHVESLARSQPKLFENAFGHINPECLIL